MDLVRNCVPPPHVFEHGVHLSKALITQSTGACGVGAGVGACVGSDVGLGVGDGLGALVGLDVGAVVGCSVGAGVGHATFGHDSDCVTSVHSLSSDVRVRCLTPLLPHDAEHAPNGPKAL